jgi:hypothetical protein
MLSLKKKEREKINLGISQSSRASNFKLEDQGFSLILTQSSGGLFAFYPINNN